MSPEKAYYHTWQCKLLSCNRPGLLFNEEIQSRYYQNTLVSFEGALLEWVKVGHWSNNLKQDAAATNCNMRDELCINRNLLELVQGLDVGGTVWNTMDGATVSYHCGKSIIGQMILSLELTVATDAQVEAPGHGKWWLDGKTGSDKHYYQQCIRSIITPEVVDSGKYMFSAMWRDCSGVLVAVSPAAECICMLSNTAHIKGIKSMGMQASCKRNALVECNNYEWYTMDNVPPIPNYKIVYLTGKYNGIRAYYNIRTDPDLGLGYAALWRVACGCDACKEQLGRPWLQCADMFEQPQYNRTTSVYCGQVTKGQTIGKYASCSL
jgi:hypothetical protein